MTSESALVVPVPEAESVVEDLRTRFDPAAPGELPAHITVLYPFFTPDTLDESILDELGAIFSAVAPFRFNLSEIAQFPDVIYLTPVPVDRFSRLTAAIATRWPQRPPYGGIYDEVIPHLTVAHTSEAAAAKEIRRRIQPDLPITCTADQAWLMISSDGGWSRRRRFPFDGTP